VIRIGLTGGLASGKSTVAAYLSALGAAVFDADRIVSDLYRPGGPGEAADAELFGPEVLDPRGAVDRTSLARIVFADPAKRHALESRIHPMVGAEIERLFEEARRKGARVAVAEASQLLEAAAENRCDRVLLVIAPDEQRIGRWLGKGGDPDDARRRMAAQISPEEARRRATDVLINDGSLEELKEEVGEVFRRWTTTKE
jgi:dephospho-CoA kinase